MRHNLTMKVSPYLASRSKTTELVCEDCQSVFVWTKRAESDYRVICGPCKSNRKRLENTYGFTVDDYNTQAAKQEHKCIGCNQVKKLVIDHCHTTGKVRGLLCGSCNTALGMVKDDPATLRALATYIDNAHSEA